MIRIILVSPNTIGVSVVFIKFRGCTKRALPYFQRALAIAENGLGPDHPSTGGQYGEMGSILADLGRYEEAIPYFRKSIEVRSRYQDT